MTLEQIPQKLNFCFLPLLMMLLLSCTSLKTYAQVEDVKKNKEEEFKRFRDQNENDYQNFLSRNDSIFLKHLEESWKEFTVFTEERIKRPKPFMQPIAPKTIENIELPSPDTVLNINKIEVIEENKEEGQPTKSSGNTLPDTKLFIDFFGQQIEFEQVKDVPVLKNLENNSILEFYKTFLSDQTLKKITTDLFTKARGMKLNDWGYLLLVKNASSGLFKSANEQVLFTWITMLKTGLNARIGYDNKNIYLLIGTKETLFDKRYLKIGGNKYYLILYKDQENPKGGLMAYETDHPVSNRLISPLINELPLFEDEPRFNSYIYGNETINIRINLKLIEFFKEYPSCELAVYFNAPISEKTITSLDKLIKPLLQGKTDVEKVNILLDVIQKSFPYKTDIDQFGSEKYMFGDETVYYPFTDCEDRAVLMAHLVKRFTGLETIGLDYPEHVTIGVKFKEYVVGDYITFRDGNYYICDPTYIGADVGTAMDEIKNTNPKLIIINN